MLIQLVHHKVKEYRRWRTVFDEHAPTRKEAGGQGCTIYRTTGDSLDLVILAKWESQDRAIRSAEDSKLKDIMEKAGIIGSPEIYFLEELEKLPF
jgi:hypothetical protein